MTSLKPSLKSAIDSFGSAGYASSSRLQAILGRLKCGIHGLSDPLIEEVLTTLSGHHKTCLRILDFPPTKNVLIDYCSLLSELAKAYEWRVSVLGDDVFSPFITKMKKESDNNEYQAFSRLLEKTVTEMVDHRSISLKAICAFMFENAMVDVDYLYLTVEFLRQRINKAYPYEIQGCLHQVQCIVQICFDCPHEREFHIGLEIVNRLEKNGFIKECRMLLQNGESLNAYEAYKHYYPTSQVLNLSNSSGSSVSSAEDEAYDESYFTHKRDETKREKDERNTAVSTEPCKRQPSRIPFKVIRKKEPPSESSAERIISVDSSHSDGRSASTSRCTQRPVDSPSSDSQKPEYRSISRSSREKHRSRSESRGHSSRDEELRQWKMKQLQKEQEELLLIDEIEDRKQDIASHYRTHGVSITHESSVLLSDTSASLSPSQTIKTPNTGKRAFSSSSKSQQKSSSSRDGGNIGSHTPQRPTSGNKIKAMKFKEMRAGPRIRKLLSPVPLPLSFSETSPLKAKNMFQKNEECKTEDEEEDEKENNNNLLKSDETPEIDIDDSIESTEDAEKRSTKARRESCLQGQNSSDSNDIILAEGCNESNNQEEEKSEHEKWQKLMMERVYALGDKPQDKSAEHHTGNTIHSIQQKHSSTKRSSPFPELQDDSSLLFDDQHVIYYALNKTVHAGKKSKTSNTPTKEKADIEIKEDSHQRGCAEEVTPPSRASAKPSGKRHIMVKVMICIWYFLIALSSLLGLYFIMIFFVNDNGFSLPMNMHLTEYANQMSSYVPLSKDNIQEMVSKSKDFVQSLQIEHQVNKAVSETQKTIRQAQNTTTIFLQDFFCTVPMEMLDEIASVIVANETSFKVQVNDQNILATDSETKRLNNEIQLNEKNLQKAYNDVEKSYEERAISINAEYAIQQKGMENKNEEEMHKLVEHYNQLLKKFRQKKAKERATEPSKTIFEEKTETAKTTIKGKAREGSKDDMPRKERKRIGKVLLSGLLAIMTLMVIFAVSTVIKRRVKETPLNEAIDADDDEEYTSTEEREDANDDEEEDGEEEDVDDWLHSALTTKDFNETSLPESSLCDSSTGVEVHRYPQRRSNRH